MSKQPLENVVSMLILIPIVVNKTRSCTCIKIKVLASLTSESGITFLGEGGGVVGRSETKHFIGMALPFLLLLCKIFYNFLQ